MRDVSQLIIGLSEKPRFSKDTVAYLLEKEFPHLYRTNFSHAITAEYDALLGANTRTNENEKAHHCGGIQTLALVCR